MNSANQAKIYISAKDNTGKIRNLSVKAWEEITGKNGKSIRNHYNRNRKGEINVSNRVIVGFEEFDYHAIARAERSKSKKIEIDRESLVFRFLCCRRLV